MDLALNTKGQIKRLQRPEALDVFEHLARVGPAG